MIERPPTRKRRKLRLFVAALGVLALLVLGAVSVVVFWRGNDGSTFLSDIIAQTLSTENNRVSIGSVEGALSSDAIIRDLTISDRDGVWLKLDRARLIWNRGALLSRKLSVESIELDHLDVYRRPVDADGTASEENNRNILPDLPVKVVVRSFKLNEARLWEPVIGQDARLSLNGSVELGDPSEGLQLNLALKRLDAPGNVSAFLSFIPGTEELTLNLNHDEPAGGIAARLMRLPNLPPVRFEVKGHGVLDDFKATMAYVAGEQLNADGTATLLRDGSARKLDIDATARIEALLPQPAALIAAGTTTLTGRVIFGDDNSVAIRQFDIASGIAKLQLSGLVSAERHLDLALSAQSLSGQDGRTRAGQAELKHLDLVTTVKGAMNAPDIQARLEVSGFSSPEGKLESGLVTVNAAPQSAMGKDLLPTQVKWALRADAQLDGIASPQGKWADVIGSRLTLAIKAMQLENGIFDVDIFKLTTPTLDASYRGKVSKRGADGLLEAVSPDLAAFSALAGKRLRGNLQLTSKLDGTLDDRLIVETDARLQGLSLDVPALDGLMGGAATLKGRAQIRKDGLAFDDIRFDAAQLAARLGGSIGRQSADARLRMDIADLGKADARLKGRATATADITGTLAHPDVALSVTTDKASALDRPIEKLTLDVVARDLLGTLDASLDLQGEIGRKALVGKARLLRPQGDSWRLDGVDLRMGSATVLGALSATNGMADGNIKIAASDLDELSALVLTRLSGAFNAELALSADGGRQNGRLVANGANIRFQAVSLERLDADLSAGDLYRKPVLNGSFKGLGWTIAGQKIDNLSLDAKGNDAESIITLGARGSQGLAVEGRAAVVPADPVLINMSALSVRRDRQSVALARPVTLTVRGGVLGIPDLAINAGSGAATLSGELGLTGNRDSDLTMVLRQWPLSVAGLAAPQLELSGTIDGRVVARGPIARPQGQYDLTVNNVMTPQIRNAGLPPADVVLKGQLRGDQTAFNAAVTVGRAGRLQIDGTAPMNPAGNLAVRINGQLDVSAANSMLSASGQQVTGRLNIDASLSGRADRPAVAGQATLSNATFTDPLRGVRLTRIDGRFVGQGDNITVERLTGQTRNGGTISVSGRVDVDPDRGFPGSFRIDASRAELVSNDTVAATANMALTMSGPLAQTPRVSGSIELVTMDVMIPDRIPATAQPLPNARHISPPPAVRARLEAQRRARQQASRTPAFNAGLDLTISAPSRIFVRGRGVDAELGGEVRLTGTSLQPVVVGGFDMRRGRLTIIGQRLDLSRGKLSFTGDLTPELDFLAETQASEITARVAVTGPANQPAFALSSSPDLPNDEILARLLFSRASGSLSPFQALQLAQAVSQLSGTGGPDVFDKTRKALGLDSLDITAGSGGGPAVGASRYINDRISVGVQAGAKPEDNAASVRIDLTRRLKVQGDIDADGRTSVGIGAEWEY